MKYMAQLDQSDKLKLEFFLEPYIDKNYFDAEDVAEKMEPTLHKIFAKKFHEYSEQNLSESQLKKYFKRVAKLNGFETVISFKPIAKN